MGFDRRKSYCGSCNGCGGDGYNHANQQLQNFCSLWNTWMSWCSLQNTQQFWLLVIYLNSTRSIYDITYMPWWIDVSRSTVVGTVTRLQAEQFMVWIPVKERDFLFSEVSRTALGTIHLPIQWVLGFLPGGVKWPKHKAKHSLPLSARLRISGAIPLFLLYAFIVWTGTTWPFLTLYAGWMAAMWGIVIK